MYLLGASVPARAPRFLTVTAALALALAAPVRSPAAGPETAANPAWTFAARGPVFSTASSADGVIFIGSDDGHVYALDAGDGTQRWSQSLGAPVRSRPWIDGALVYVVCGNDAFALAREDGSIRWTFSARDSHGAAPADRWDYHQSSIVGHGRLLYYGAGNGTFYALDRLSGAPQFTFATDGQAAIRATPVVSGHVVYFGDWNGMIYALDATHGLLRWKRATMDGPKPYPQFGGAVSALVAHEGRLLFGLRNPDVICLDLTTGDKAWTFTAKDGSWVPGTPVIAGETVYITGSDDHTVHALDVRTGASRWACNVGANMFVTPVVAGNHVLVTDGNSYAEDAGRGRLHVIDRASGTLVRSVVLGANAAASSPVLIADRVVVGCEDGRVLALDLATLLE